MRHLLQEFNIQSHSGPRFVLFTANISENAALNSLIYSRASVCISRMQLIQSFITKCGEAVGFFLKIHFPFLMKENKNMLSLLVWPCF